MTIYKYLIVLLFEQMFSEFNTRYERRKFSFPLSLLTEKAFLKHHIGNYLKNRPRNM